MGMVCLYGIFISGVTLDDQDLVNGTLYGVGGTKEKPTGGFMDCFKPACIRDDRLWGADQKPEDQIASLAIMISVPRRCGTAALISTATRQGLEEAL